MASVERFATPVRVCCISAWPINGREPERRQEKAVVPHDPRGFASSELGGAAVEGRRARKEMRKPRDG